MTYDVVKQIEKSVGGLLTSYAKEIELVMAEDGSVLISLPLKIKRTGPKLDIKVGIGFVKERIKDAVGFTIDGQKELFPNVVQDMPGHTTKVSAIG